MMPDGGTWLSAASYQTPATDASDQQPASSKTWTTWSSALLVAVSGQLAAVAGVWQLAADSLKKKPRPTRPRHSFAV